MRHKYMITYEKAGYLATVNSSVFYKEYCIESSGQGTCTHLYILPHCSNYNLSLCFFGVTFL